MTDEELVRAFEACTLPPAQLRHREHLLVAWTYLRALPFPEAAARFRASLRRFAEAHGALARYHETITWAYVTLLAERMQGSTATEFDAFVAGHPDLLDHERGILATYYDAETLGSDLARAVFVLPRPKGQVA